MAPTTEERKVTLQNVEGDEMKSLLNCVADWQFKKDLQRALDRYEKNISYTGGVINEPDLTDLTVNSRGNYAFNTNELWEVIPEGKTAKSLSDEVTDLIDECKAAHDKRLDSNFTTDGQIYLDITNEKSE